MLSKFFKRFGGISIPFFPIGVQFTRITFLSCNSNPTMPFGEKKEVSEFRSCCRDKILVLVFFRFCRTSLEQAWAVLPLPIKMNSDSSRFSLNFSRREMKKAFPSKLFPIQWFSSNSTRLKPAYFYYVSGT